MLTTILTYSIIMSTFLIMTIIATITEYVNERIYDNFTDKSYEERDRIVAETVKMYSLYSPNAEAYLDYIEEA